MPTKRRRVERNIIEGISETAMHVMGDGELYPEPEGGLDDWELLMSVGYPTVCWEESRRKWNAARDRILKDWIRERPGTRPSFWWIFDAPRMSAQDLERNGWDASFFSDHLAAPRLRLGGVGDPKFEHFAYTPTFRCGVPAEWIDASDLEEHPDPDVRAIDPIDPPRFESQAAYLKRQGLLQPGEERRLKSAAFEPEVIGSADPDGDLQ